MVVVDFSVFHPLSGAASLLSYFILFGTQQLPELLFSRVSIFPLGAHSRSALVWGQKPSYYPLLFLEELKGGTQLLLLFPMPSAYISAWVSGDRGQVVPPTIRYAWAALFGIYSIAVKVSILNYFIDHCILCFYKINYLCLITAHFIAVFTLLKIFCFNL